MRAKWMAGSCASFHLLNSADVLSVVRVCNVKIKEGGSLLVDVVWYGTRPDVVSGYLADRLPNVAYVPDIALNLFSLMATHEQGARCTTEEDLCLNLFNGRLKFEGDGCSYSTFAYRVEPDDGYVPFLILVPDSSGNCVETGCDLPLAFPVPSPGSLGPPRR